jgi:pimeloyl-ACP methyl ester carboxylesterase
VIVPDLRGRLSSHPSGGYDKKTQGGDIAGVLDTLAIGKADLVTHDIGNMVGYAFAAEHPDRVTKFVLMDAPLPGPVGRNLEVPAVMALPLWRSGHGKAGEGARANLPRPFLE